MRSNKKQYTFMVEPDIHIKLKRLAALNDRKVSDEVHTMITEYLDKNYPDELDEIITQQRTEQS
jgi:hypothetical protein